MTRKVRKWRAHPLPAWGIYCAAVLAFWMTLISQLAPALGQEDPSILRKKRRLGLQVKTIDEMLRLPEEEIDVGTGALLIEKVYYPDLSVPKYVKQLDVMVREAWGKIKHKRNLKATIAVLNDCVSAYRGQGVFDASEDVWTAGFLHVLLERKDGTCVALAVLYLSLAERIGLPVHAVCVPKHVFVRYSSGSTHINIEPGRKGVHRSEGEYMKRYRVPTQGAGHSLYLTSLSKKQFLGILLEGLGWALSRRSELHRAMDAFEKAASINPNFVNPWLGIGEVYRKSGSLRNAENAYEKARAICPNCNAVWAGLAALYREWGELDKCVQAYGRALAINPNDAGDWSMLGLVHAKRGEPEKAAKAYRKALAIEENNPFIWHMLGSACEKKGDSLNGVFAYKKAVAWSSCDFWTSYCLACVCLQLGKYERATRLFEQACQFREECANAWACLGGVYAGQGKHDQAAQAYKRSLDIKPTEKRVWRNLALMYEKQGKLGEAVRTCREGGLVGPRDANLWYVFALEYSCRSNDTKSVETCKQALSADPGLAKAWSHLGYIYRVEDHLSESIEAYKKAISIDPSHEEPWSALAYTYLLAGSLPESADAYEEALTLVPENASQWSILSWIYAEQRRIWKFLMAQARCAFLNPIGYVAYGLVYTALPLLFLFFFLRTKTPARTHRIVAGLLMLIALLICHRSITSLFSHDWGLWTHRAAKVALTVVPAAVAFIAGIWFLIRKSCVPDGQIESPS